MVAGYAGVMPTPVPSLADWLRSSHVYLRGPFSSVDAAWAAAAAIVAAATDDTSLEVIGEFAIPPADGSASRSFQTLHIDFGLPLVPAQPADVARFTALHVAADAKPSGASTRLVELALLLSHRGWPDRQRLIDRFAAYGRSHGAWDDAAGYLEGSLARVVEAAIGDEPELPSVKSTRGFQCGLEFASLAEELAFFDQRGLPLKALEQEICLAPGELLIFDNLRVAHGRCGARQPGELHQRLLGHRQMPPRQQRAIRDQFLATFA